MKRDHVSAQPGNWLGAIALLSFFLAFVDDARSNAQAPVDKSSGWPPVVPSDSSNWSDTANRDFQNYCLRCHGNDFTGAEFHKQDRHIPDFTDRLWQNGRANAQLFESIKDGKGSRMPPFEDRLDDERVRNLVRLVRSKVIAASPAISRSAIRVSRPRLSPSDFERRFAELEIELETLQKQFRETSNATRKSETLKTFVRPREASQGGDP